MADPTGRIKPGDVVRLKPEYGPGGLGRVTAAPGHGELPADYVWVWVVELFRTVPVDPELLEKVSLP